MGAKKLQPHSNAIWALARRQHWVVTRAQLLERGLGSRAIRHRLRTGRLHPLRRGVYAVGRADVDSHGRWMAAVLACGPLALLSHESAAALLRISQEKPGPIDSWSRTTSRGGAPASAFTGGRASVRRATGRSEAQP